jgi:hypothetical protein
LRSICAWPSAPSAPVNRAATVSHCNLADAQQLDYKRLRHRSISKWTGFSRSSAAAVMMRPVLIVLLVICRVAFAPGGDGSGNPFLDSTADLVGGDSSAIGPTYGVDHPGQPRPHAVPCGLTQSRVGRSASDRMSNRIAPLDSFVNTQWCIHVILGGSIVRRHLHQPTPGRPLDWGYMYNLQSPNTSQTQRLSRSGIRRFSVRTVVCDVLHYFSVTKMKLVSTANNCNVPLCATCKCQIHFLFVPEKQ